ncbi:MAG: beta strand repeat-containing protein, partial [Anaerolineales bacterium]
ESGAYLDNTASATQASVTVKNSTFNSNNRRGLTIYSNGAVTLNNVSASANGNRGVQISNTFDSTPSVVSVTKGFFNNNGAAGLYIASNGAVKLSQITALSNSDIGVLVDNTPAAAPQAVTVSGFLTANDNGNYGLYILSDGAVTLSNITADGNTNGGAFINNIAAPKPQAVTISGVNSMSYNSIANGLYILTLGAVTLSSITAQGNGDYGVYIDNAASPVPSAVNIKGVNVFSNNGNTGLNVFSAGAINLYNITANGNAAVSNDVGVYLSNDTNPAKPQNVSLFGVNTFNSNAEGGLVIFTYGAVTLNNISAYYNGFDTVDGSGDGVYVDNDGGTLAKPVSLKGVNAFHGNDGGGLVVYSLGAVSVSNISANYNGWLGAYIDSAGSSFQSPVTISGYGVFNANSYSGLAILSRGAVTTTNLSASGNLGYGVYIYTIGITKPQAVTMKGNNTFTANGDAGFESGLVVSADGNITVSNLTASQNFYMGARLDNYTNWAVNSFPTFGSIVVTGFGNFFDNGNDGIYVETQGNVTLSYITAVSNGDDGVFIWTHGTGSKVNLTCVLATQNDFGLWMNAPASVLTIKGLSASGNTTTNETLAYVLLIRSGCP